MTTKVRPFVAALQMVRFTARWFFATSVYDFVIFVVVPIPLGLATRAFFSGLQSRGVAGAIAAIVALQVVDLFASPMLGNPWNHMQQKAQVLLQRNLFGAILRGYGRQGLPVPVGDAISRFRDDPPGMADVLDGLADLVTRSMFVIVSGVVMWAISPVITAALLVPIVLSIVITEALGGRIMARHYASRSATGALTGFLGDVVGAQLAIKVAGATGHVLSRLSALSDTRRRAAVRDSVLGEVLNSIMYHLAHIGTGFVLLFGARQVRNGTFTVADLALFVVYLDQLTWYPAEIGRVVGDLKHIRVSLDRMQEVVPSEAQAALVAPAPVYLRSALPPLPPEPARERLERLEVRGLTYEHHGDVNAIEDVTFTIERGSFTVITGRIGAGKTTLLRVLLGLLPADTGEILWNGRLVEDPSAFFVPPRSAYTPQVPRLFSDTMRDNIVFGRPYATEAVDAAVRAAVLEPDVATLAQGLDTMVGPRGVKLSGGQAQRTAAARMFVRDAELLVFDDLSSALDAETEAELWTRLFARGRDATCLVVSHRPAALRRADQVLSMDEGRLHA